MSLNNMDAEQIGKAILTHLTTLQSDSDEARRASARKWLQVYLEELLTRAMKAEKRTFPPNDAP